MNSHLHYSHALHSPLLKLLLMAALLQAEPVESAATIHFSCVSRPEQKDFQAVNTLYKKAFRQLGYEFRMTHLPSNQLHTSTFEQRFDGDCGRLPNFLKELGINSLARVGVPVRTATISSWKLASDTSTPTRQKTIAQLSPQLQMMRPYLKQLGFQVAASTASYQAAMDKLRNGHAHRLILYEAEDVRNTSINKEGLVRDEKLMIAPIQPLLHIRHKALLPKLERQLQGLLDNSVPHKNPTPPPQPSSSPNQLVFSCGLPPSHPATQAAIAMYKALFMSLGLTYQQVHTPITEESALLKRGHLDGTCGRPKEFSETNPELIRIRVPSGIAHMRLWGRTPSPRVDNLSNLKVSDSIVIAGETSDVTRLLQSFPGKTAVARTADQALKMVIAGRADYFLGYTTAPLDQLHSHQIKTPLFFIGNINSGSIYLYLQPKHQHLAEAITNAIKQRTGNYPSLLDAWLKRKKASPLH